MFCMCAQYSSHVVDTVFDGNDIDSMLGRCISSPLEDPSVAFLAYTIFQILWGIITFGSS